MNPITQYDLIVHLNSLDDEGIRELARALYDLCGKFNPGDIHCLQDFIHIVNNESTYGICEVRDE